jgi:two-component system LytT family sensor kinase
VIYLLLVAYLISPYHDYVAGIFPAFSILIFHALVSYLNLLFFLPNLLFEKKYISYLLSLFLTILLVCFPLAVIVNNFFLSNSFLSENIWTPMFFAVNSIYILLTVSVTSFIHLISDWYRKDRINKELERMNTQQELRFLKSQINPHFLLNSLNNIYALSLIKSDKTPDMVMSLSRLLRYLLYETSESKVSLIKEIEYLEDLLALERIRVGDRATITFEIDGEPDLVMIEPLLFINFVENSFKHGVNSANKQSWMKINLEIEANGKRLCFRIENSKPLEKTSQKDDRHGGIGLENARKRLKLLYPDKHLLNITDNKDTYKVELKLELN